ncbi:caspase family protein [Leptodesmis sp.]|uniref:caspase family protein n=1 Tax=Leptodesmis sp. TaxID=3100501 RepID=UPI0040535B63
MEKAALLVGVSSCQMDLPPLRKARTNGEVLKRALQSMNNGFQVETLYDKPLPEMAEAIERFFRQREGDDQILFLFSGYGIQDVDGQLYFVSPSTALDEWGHLLRSRTLPASFLLNIMNSSPAWRQVVIFDCCFRLTLGIAPDQPEVLMESIFDHMIGNRRVILTATTYTQHEPEPKSLDAWSYTRYLAEGASTGSADTDCDGSLTVKELHCYAKEKLRIAAPDQHPQFYGSEETANQMVLQVPSRIPSVRYRQFLEKITQSSESEIDKTEFRILTGRNLLNDFRHHLGLSLQDATEIEDQVLRPWRERQQRLQLYQEKVSKLMHRGQDESE